MSPMTGLQLLGIDELGADAGSPSLDDVRHGDGVLKRGQKGAAVEYVQAIAPAIVDGNFGPKTEEAVRGFQRAHGLPATGVVDQATLGEMDRLAGGAKAGVEKITIRDASDSAQPASRSAAQAPGSSGSQKDAALSTGGKAAVAGAMLAAPLLIGGLGLGLAALIFAFFGED